MSHKNRVLEISIGHSVITNELASRKTNLSYVHNRDREIQDELSCKKRVLMKDGIWLVPEEERFKGWEKLGKET